MDVSETYIKMCETAKEIQDPPTIRGDIIAGDFVANVELGKVTVHSGKYPISSKLIWLPRQDQLQEMIKREMLHHLVVDFYLFCDPHAALVDGDKEYEYISLFTSMEQLWLAFVMREKYGKTWNSRGWMAVSDDFTKEDRLCRKKKR